jgi:hypothetical protein
MYSNETEIFLKEYTRALREDDAALFVGAGVSQPAGYVDWKQLLKDIAEDLDLDIDQSICASLISASSAVASVMLQVSAVNFLYAGAVKRWLVETGTRKF